LIRSKLDETSASCLAEPGCVYALVADRTGRVVAHTDRKQLGTMISRYAVSPSPATTAKVQGPIQTNTETSIKEITVRSK